ncbi:MAG: DUF4956 domain-containing protein [Chloroflexi bacterium]|nr:DUF4956 domain-containing protein [Chloroflexota bacterium]
MLDNRGGATHEPSTADGRGDRHASPGASFEPASDRRSPVVAVLLLSILVLLGILIGVAGGLIAVPRAQPSTQPGTPASGSGSEFERLVGLAGQILPASPTNFGEIVVRLILAAVLGGAIAFRGSRRRHEYVIVHSNIIVAFTGAMMMIIVGSDIARAFGLVGASSIIRFRTPVSDPRALSGLFVAMAAGIAVGVGLYELAIAATLLLILVELLMDRGGRFFTHGWYRPERNYTFAIHTEEPDRVLDAAQLYFRRHSISSRLMEYERGKKGDAAKMLLLLGVPEGLDMEELTREVLAQGARSVSWESSKEL